jgi:hypothetical protein
MRKTGVLEPRARAIGRPFDGPTETFPRRRRVPSRLTLPGASSVPIVALISVRMAQRVRQSNVPCQGKARPLRYLTDAINIY